jgi:uncharacterized membrane protein YeaQ/YmgE (transglycosylase-associated protein family)
MKGTKTVSKTVGERLGGGRPGPFSAALTAAVVGGAVAVTVYRALRS